jgi:hypothetical protein
MLFEVGYVMPLRIFYIGLEHMQLTFKIVEDELRQL